WAIMRVPSAVQQTGCADSHACTPVRKRTAIRCTARMPPSAVLDTGKAGALRGAAHDVVFIRNLNP
ncbi:MAG: hypothetical protein ACT6T0_07815, partial [Nevskia sp.]|uniref:hypothetical protein n=1 Tax=Nevskia sp. TaxID=1929292 RepID=UPI00403736E4